MARQVKPLLVHACDPREMKRMRPRQERWDEVEALFERAGRIARSIVDVVPRRDSFTEAGSRRISRERLAARAHSLSDTAVELRSACEGAQSGLPYLDSLVEYLTGVAEQLDLYAEVLAMEREQTVEALEVAVHLTRRPLAPQEGAP